MVHACVTGMSATWGWGVCQHGPSHVGSNTSLVLQINKCRFEFNELIIRLQITILEEIVFIVALCQWCHCLSLLTYGFVF